MKQLVNLFRTARRKNDISNPYRKPVRRRLQSESLEKRELLAGDILAAHNYAIAEDVNRDFKITPLDALLVINHLSRNGGSQDLASVERGDMMHYVDVSADNSVTPLDALRVINRLSRGEAVGELVELRLTPRVADDTGAISPRNPNGDPAGAPSPELDFDPATRTLTVGVNEIFNLEVNYLDLRNRFGGDFGAFAIYTNILTSLPDVVQPVLTETQIISISGNIREARSGDLLFALSDDPANTVPIDINTFAANPIDGIITALAGLGFDADKLSVVELPNEGLPTDPLDYQIRFLDFDLDGVDIPELVVTSDLDDQSGQPVVVTSTNDPIEVRNPDGSINQTAIGFNLNVLSRTFGNNRPFFGFGASSVGSFDPDDGFEGVGASGPITLGGVPALGEGALIEPFDSFSIPIRVTEQVDNLQLSLAPTGNPGTQILLYESDDPVPDAMVLINLENDLTVATDGFGLINILTVGAGNTAPTISDVANVTINQGANTGALTFTVGDAETAPGSLTVTGTSSNPTLVPNANIVFGGSGANRTVTVTPVAGQTGTATITLTVSDGTATASDTFVLTVNAVGANTAPTISDIANVTINQGANTGALTFTVGDAETAPGSLTVTGTSSNPTLVPNANIVFGGSGANRTVTVTPAAGQTGTATITVTVSDGTLTASDTFVLTVNAVANTAPTISDIANVTINQGANTGALTFTVGDAETAPGSLTVTGTSSNTTLVPNANIVFGGSGANRTVTVTPAAGQSGTATITVTVSDGTATASDTFVLTVNAVANTAPTISDIANVTINQGANTGALTFTVGDAQTAPGSLTVTGTSSNTTLVPNANIVFGGSGANRTVTVTPVASQSGTATITVTVSDGTATASDTFVLTVNAVAGNTAPTISDIANVTINEGANTGAINFTVADAQTAAGSLTVTGTSSNTALVPNASIVFGGSGANRTVTVTPATNASGTATITVTVSDGTLTGSDTFVLTVNGVNDPPTGASATRTITAGSVYTFSAADFPITDTLDSPANTLSAVVITTLPNASQGTLRLAGVPVTAGQVVTVSQLPTLTFTPAGTTTGNNLGAFTFQVRDSGGTANGGVDTDPTPRTFAFNVISFSPSSISGTIFTDFVASLENPTRDGEKSENEPAIGGLTVRLTNGSNVDTTQFTDASGSYAFANLAPGTYTVTFEVPDTLVPGEVIAGTAPISAATTNSFQVTIGAAGGVTATGHDFTVFGVTGAARGTLAILVSQYEDSIESQEFVGTAFAVLGASGEQEFFDLSEGFEGVRFAEISLNEKRDAALLTVLMEDGTVASSRMTGDDFTVSRNGQVVRVTGSAESFSATTTDAATLEAEFGEYRDAIDSILRNS